MQEAPVRTRAHHVDVGAGDDIVAVARADLQIERRDRRAVDHVMAVAAVFGEGSAIARPEQRFAAVLDQRQLALQHIDELVLMAVPVALARPAAGRQCHQVDAEIGEAAGIAEAPARAGGARGVEGCGVAGAFADGDD